MTRGYDYFDYNEDSEGLPVDFVWNPSDNNYEEGWGQ